MKTCIFEFQCINFTKTWSTEECVDTVCITEPARPYTLHYKYIMHLVHPSEECVSNLV